MNAKEHPDYVHEQEKLAMIQKTITDEKAELIAKSRNYKKLSKEVITDPTVFNQLMKIDQSRLEILETLINKPYFGRVDFCEIGKQTESYFIGKTSVDDAKTKKLLVLDWRAPLAGLYYSGDIGEVMYNSPEGLIIGDLYLKRQYEIVDGVLVNIFDKGLTPMDEFLQKALWEKKDNRLGDIVTTIQDEQNQIIRASKDGVLIIQGVAGSGKTTIVLHRIAYLMYTYQDIFKAEKILMIVPNKLFLDYISDVLPDLGVHDIEQVTFEMLYEQSFGKRLNSNSEVNKLKKLIQLNKEDEVRKALEFVSAFKGSLSFKRIIDDYIGQMLLEALPKEDVILMNQTLYSYDELEKLFNGQFTYLPLAKRKEKVMQYIKDTIEDRVVKIEARINKQYKEKLVKIKQDTGLTENERNKKISILADKRIEYTNILNESILSIPKEYLTKWVNFDIEKLLLKLLSDASLMKKHSKTALSEEEIQIICDYTHNRVKGKIEYEDIPALIYMKFVIEGSPLLKKYTHIVVDEAQDYNPFQMHVLTMTSANKSFTIVGDIAQGINAYRGISNWDDLSLQVFKANTTYKTISICYRSTKEIIDFGNAVISSLEDDNIVLGKPALRRGNKPSVIACEDQDTMLSGIFEKVRSLKRQNFKSVAIICKVEATCKLVYEKMLPQFEEEVQMFTGQEEHYRSGITIMTPQLSKGLEFDAVIIVDLKPYHYDHDPLDIKLLYVAITRALHELVVFHVGQASGLIKNIDVDLYHIA